MLLDTPTQTGNRALTVTAIQFWTDYEPDPENAGQLRSVDWVKWGKRGQFSGAANVEKVARVMKPLKSMTDDGQMTPNPVWVAIEPQYSAWKQGQATPVDGTPLDAWSALSKAQAQAFREAGFSAVEHIAGIEDGELGKVRLPDTRRVRDLARAYVQHRTNFAATEHRLASQDAELADMKAQLAEATAALQRLAASAEDGEPARRGPGRPRKPEGMTEVQG